MCYTRGMNTNTSETGGVQCRLVLADGRVVAFTLAGPLVTMPVKTKKGGKRGH